jgi:hypothetical protein
VTGAVLAITGNTWIEVVLIASAVVPLGALAALVWWFVRNGRNDPDEQRRRRLDEQRRAAGRSG